ncbi:MAG TPA: PIN domain nuclease [Solibacterales bacterium]|nr:PIN domain nuclease [Bryobacterales bacterium]
MLDVLIVRLFIIAVTTASAYYFRPLNWSPLASSVTGTLLGAVIILAEMRLRLMSLKRLIGAALGALVGAVAASLISWALVAANPNHSPTLHFFQLGLLVWSTYIGLAVGANKGELLDFSALGGVLGVESHAHKASKILDTSVIIDGRIADIADTGFLDSLLVIPQFVLRELQLVADSSDSMKRNRGRRGLDVLQRIQKMPHLQVQIVEDDFPAVREVDMKLIELAKLYEAKIVTNDFNLNKVAQLRGVEVLNINELANSLKPIVLPGELMRVFILKEGKEFNQGVAYLDDGTMVVVDNAKRMIAKTIEISVTSVLQTTAGKMIFGKFDDRAHAATVSESRPARREQAVGEN